MHNLIMVTIPFLTFNYNPLPKTYVEKTLSHLKLKECMEV